MRRVAVAGLEVSVLVGTDLVDGICSTRESGELSFVYGDICFFRVGSEHMFSFSLQICRIGWLVGWEPLSKTFQCQGSF